MSTPINSSNIMIYKIVKDFEQGKTINTFDELKSFANFVINYVNSKTNESFWIIESNESNIEMKENLSRLCDLTTSFCEINEFKYKNGGEAFAKLKIGAMPYMWLKGAIKTYKEMQCQTIKDSEKSL